MIAAARPRAALTLNPFQERIAAAFRAGATEVWAFGGNRAGKTWFGGAWAAAGAVGDRRRPATWVCCRDSDAQREATQPAVLAFLAPHEIRRTRRGRPVMFSFRGKIDRVYTRGGVIQFRNYADGPSSVRGPTAARVWADELTGERAGDFEYYREIRRAVVPTRGRLLFTLTAVKGLTPVLADVLERHRGGEPGLAIVTGSIYDNAQNLPPGSIEQFERGLDEWEREVRLHGRVLPLAGRPYIGADVLARLAVRPSIRVEKVSGLDVEIFEEPADGRYVIGVDAAEGVGRDRGAVVVLAVGWERPARVVAVGIGDVPPAPLGDAAAALAERYRGVDRTALVEPEANGPGLVVIERLKDRHVRIAGRPGAEDAVGAPVRLGYLTGRRSREVLLETMREEVRTGAVEVRSAKVRDALGTFVWGARRAEAAPGFFDDPVFALGLAIFAAQDVRRPPAPPPAGAPPLTAEAHIARLKRRPFA